MYKKSFQLLLTLGVALSVAISLIPILSGAGSELPNDAFVQTIPANDPFPHQAELAGRVNFWRHVFGVWDRNQVALHDMSNPGLVYEVLTLPEGRSGSDRKDLINEHLEKLSHRLYILEQKVARGADLEDGERELLDKFRTWGKISQLAGAHSRVRMQRGIREKFLQGIELSGRYDSLFRRIFRAHGVPEDLAFLPHVESSFQAHARSGAGAVGIWQFTLPAARLFMKVNAAVDERYDPVLAAEGCARYLASAYEKLGDWALAITSYNHGIGGMSRAESEFGTDFLRILEEYDGPVFGFDSRNFYVEFLAAREVARNAERYFGKVHWERPQNWEKVAIERSTPIHEIARNYGVTLTELSEINSALTNNAIRGRVSLPEGTSVWLPAGTQQRVATRGVEEETPIEPIRVVRRTPAEPAESRMLAMAEDPLPIRTTKMDIPLVQRTTTSVQSKTEQRKIAMDDDVTTEDNGNVKAANTKMESIKEIAITKKMMEKHKIMISNEEENTLKAALTKTKNVQAQETKVTKKIALVKTEKLAPVQAQTKTAKTAKESLVKPSHKVAMMKANASQPGAKNAQAKVQSKIDVKGQPAKNSSASTKLVAVKGKTVAMAKVTTAKLAPKSVASTKIVAVKEKNAAAPHKPAIMKTSGKSSVTKPVPKSASVVKESKAKLANAKSSTNHHRG